MFGLYKDIFLINIRFSFLPFDHRHTTPSPCRPYSVIPTSLLWSQGSRFRLLRHVHPPSFLFSFLSDNSTSSTLWIIRPWWTGCAQPGRPRGSPAWRLLFATGMDFLYQPNCLFVSLFLSDKRISAGKQTILTARKLHWVIINPIFLLNLKELLQDVYCLFGFYDMHITRAMTIQRIKV